MIIRDKKDVELLSEILNRRLDEGRSTELHALNVKGPTVNQIKCINALIRELSFQSVERGTGEKLTPRIFKDLVYEMFIGPYADLLPDGTIRICEPSCKHGISQHEMNAVIGQIIKVFNTEYNYQLGLKKSSKGVKVA